MFKLVLSSLIVGVVFFPGEARACVQGAKCEKAPFTTSPTWAAGDTLQPGSFQVLMNSGYYGLPPSDGTSWYVRVDNRALKIDPRTYVVIEDVTHLTNRAF